MGTWSQLKLVGVRASNKGEDNFPFSRYRTAIERCRDLATDDGLPIKVVLLALGGAEEPSGVELARLEDTIAQTRDRGINVVAAAGNDGGDRVNYPARVDEVLSVGAAEPNGGLCGFSNRGDGLDLRAPGCDLDTADPRSGNETTGNGTSHASAIVAATIAALRAYDEDIDVEEADKLVLETTDDDNLDVEAAFRRADLDAVIEAGKKNVPESDQTAAGSSRRAARATASASIASDLPWLRADLRAPAICLGGTRTTNSPRASRKRSSAPET